MLTHVGSFALDDFLIASSNDIINNGFEDSALPPIIKGWLAEKVLKILPKPFLSDLLTAMIEKRNLTETLTYSYNATDHLTEISLKIYKNVQMKAWSEAGATLPETNNNDKSSIFEGDVTNFEFFDGTMLAETPMNQQISLMHKTHFSKRGDSEIDKRTRKYEENEEESENEDKPSKKTKKYQKSNGVFIKENSQTVLVDSDSSAEAGDSKIEHECKLCNKTYSTRTNLHSHLRRIHPEEWEAKLKQIKGKPRLHKRTRKLAEKDAYKDRHVCEFCDAAYTSKTGLYHHLKRWHPEKVLAGIEKRY